MAVSTAKVILFGRLVHNKQTYLWPIAVFNKLGDAKAFATVLGVAYKNGDTAGVKAMDRNAKIDDAGVLVPGLRFSITEVPYSPSPSVGASDMFDAEEAPTT